jgi:hypothetical protein
MYDSQYKTKKYILGYADVVKRYHLWYLIAYKFVINRNVIFVDDTLQDQQKYNTLKELL